MRRSTVQISGEDKKFKNKNKNQCVYIAKPEVMFVFLVLRMLSVNHHFFRLERALIFFDPSLCSELLLPVLLRPLSARAARFFLAIELSSPTLAAMALGTKRVAKKSLSVRGIL